MAVIIVLSVVFEIDVVQYQSRNFSVDALHEFDALSRGMARSDPGACYEDDTVASSREDV